MTYIYPIYTNNITRYKVYFVHNAKKIYLGLFNSEALAKLALEEAHKIMSAPCPTLTYNYKVISFKKFISLCNFRDHHIYIKNPIYTYDNYFCYFLSQDIILTFDMKDLMFFSTYKISKRGNYLYTQDHITQQSILSRFGIWQHATLGVDYKFKNNNTYDFRRENIELINQYKGVSFEHKNGKPVYVAKIFMNHTLVIGHYQTELEAAIAYNKVIDILALEHKDKNYIQNTIPYLTRSEYDALYDSIKISSSLFTGAKQKRVISSKKFRGICKDKSGFRASIGYKGKQLYLGIYPTEKRAAQAYNFASFYLYGQNGHVNETTPLIHEADTHKIARYFKKYNILK